MSGRPSESTVRRRAALAAGLLLLTTPPALARPKLQRAKSPLGEILNRMNDAAKHLKTVAANLDYTTVTVLVNDRSTESGVFYMRNPKNPEILISFQKPDPKVILFKRNRAELYYPKINRIEEYNLEHHSELVQKFLLLGFGSEVTSLKGSYQISLAGEEDIEGESTAVLELKPKQPEVSNQLSKIQIWVSEDSWLPIQQQFFEPDGDYLIARYTAMKVNRNLPASTFQIRAAKSAERVKKN